MAETPRSIHVKLTADTSEYITSIQAATAATRELRDILRSCGITEAELPTAMRAVVAWENNMRKSA